MQVYPINAMHNSHAPHNSTTGNNKRDNIPCTGPLVNKLDNNIEKLIYKIIINRTKNHKLNGDPML